jgi:antB
MRRNKMKELIKITEQNGVQAVSARELHKFLEVGKDFSNWIKDRINKYDFVEGIDFEVFANSGENPNGGRPLIEYALTLDTAKEIAMVEGNERGKQARRYFIEVEKKYKARQLSPAEFLLQQAQMLVEQERKLQQVQQQVNTIEAKLTTRPEYFSVAGYAALHKIDCGRQLASSLGRKATKICKERNIPTDNITDPRFGYVKTYPAHVLNEVFNLPITKI